MTEGSDFRVYDGQGNAKTLSDILIAMDSADVVLVGEEHNDGNERLHAEAKFLAPE